MTGIESDRALLGIQLLIPEVRFEATVAEGGGDDGGNAGIVAPIPGLAAVKVISDKWRFGFAMTAPVGGGVDYGDNFVGRYGATRSYLAGLGISPSLGYKINDKVSVGIGVTAIYTLMDLDIAINRPAGMPDGFVRIDKIDDWGAQGFAGLQWQITDKAMLGVVYRTKAEMELTGDLKIENAPVINTITGSPDTVGVDFDFPQLISLGLAYDATENLRLIFDADWEEWSQFSNNYITINSSTNEMNTGINRDWDDTWHVGAGMLYKLNQNSGITAGLAYDSSAVEDNKRTFDIPVDEQVKLGMSYNWNFEERLTYGVGLSYVWLGNGKIDQVTQGVRVKGEYDSNYLVALGVTLRYIF
jgi:long-chain fatty acid transport protein